MHPTSPPGFLHITLRQTGYMNTKYFTAALRSCAQTLLTFSSRVLSAIRNPPGTGGLSLRVSLMTQPVYFSCSKTSMSSCFSWLELHSNP